jgi:DNA polymerase III epsilon subunit-like protein
MYRYIAVDIETSGLIPGEFSMISIGACVAFDRSKVFYAELKPITEQFDPKSMEINGMSIEKLIIEGKEPERAMLEFESWIKDVSGKDKPVFVAYPAFFDWMFINYYFMRFLKRNPFTDRRPNARVIDIKTYLAAKYNLGVEEASRDKLRELFPTEHQHTHNALDDAKGYAESFEKLFKLNEH